MMTEQQMCNLRIAYKLLDVLLEEPELRFIQALWAVGIIRDDKDRFYEPSRETLDRVTQCSKEPERRLDDSRQEALEEREKAASRGK